MILTDHTTLDDGTFAEIVAYYDGKILNINFSLSGFVPLPTLVIEVMNQHYWKLTYTKFCTWKLRDFTCDANCGQPITADVITRIDKVVDMIERIEGLL